MNKQKEYISVIGAREHNLKNFDITIGIFRPVPKKTERIPSTKNKMGGSIIVCMGHAIPKRLQEHNICCYRGRPAFIDSLLCTLDSYMLLLS
jgi:hypothetical protein